MKRTALKRSRAPVKARSDRAVAEASVNEGIRLRVLARDRVCQVAAAAYGVYAVGPCFGRLTFHHRRKASAGGAYSDANGVAACVTHNDALEADADLARWARSVGLVVRRGDPEWEALGRLPKR